MALTDEINRLNSEILRCGSSNDATEKAKVPELQVRRDTLENLNPSDPRIIVPDSEIAHLPDAEKPAGRKILEGIKIEKVRLEAEAERHGITADVNNVMEYYQKIPLMNKLGMSAGFMLCAGAAGTIGGPIGLALSGIGMAGLAGQRLFGALSTFFLSEAIVNKGAEKILGKDKMPKFLKWGLSLGGAVGAYFAGPYVGKAISDGVGWMMGGLHDWAANMGFMDVNKPGGNLLHKLLTPTPGVIDPNLGAGQHHAQEFTKAVPSPVTPPNIEAPSPHNNFNMPNDSVMPFDLREKIEPPKKYLADLSSSLAETRKFTDTLPNYSL